MWLSSHGARSGSITLPLSNSSVIATARASFKPKLPFNYLGMKKMMREHLTSVDRFAL
jgi:hypothetical protein